MKPPEQIETARLRLRIPALTDAAAIFSSYAQDPEVTRYLIWRPHQELAETEAFLADCVSAWAGSNRFPYVITLKQTGAVIGMIEIRVNESDANVGYVLEQANWGKGIATEALRSLVEWALSEASIYRVWAVCDLENPASARVLEKVGMQREGVLRRHTIHPNISNEPRDSYCYAAVK